MAKRLAPPEDYRCCAGCSTWRPLKQMFELVTVTVVSSEGERPVETKFTEHCCTDRSWCEEQSNRRKGSA